MATEVFILEGCSPETFSFGRPVAHELEGQMGFSEFQGQDPSSGSGSFVPQKLKQFACIRRSVLQLGLSDILQRVLWGRGRHWICSHELGG